ncbi:MAG: hypothetical protein ACXADH_13405 [Candidatus Kariarchaeaceae archaeon]
MSLLEDVLRVKRKHQIKILEIAGTFITLSKGEELETPNITGVGVGYKMTNGRLTNDLSIVVSVVKKHKDPNDIVGEAIPEEYDGIKTDVIQTGVLQAFSALPNRSKLRPALGGSSIGHYKITAGTLGCLVKKNEETYILSNNHVLANSNDAAIGDPILQPGPSDYGSLTDQIAELSTFETISMNGGLNRVDAALAKPVEDSLVSPDIIDLSRPKGITKASLGMKVIKSGRTTQVTHEEIRQLDYRCRIKYDTDVYATFDNQLLTNWMSDGGDSGSVIMTDNNEHKVCGLLFAGSIWATIINPIQDVFDVLEIESVY